ncbi:ABC transporter substrate-binding protein [Devosia sp. SL43]|uniref:ABC transporter substrate-binding protein n=1 Tax=Devosia sp. SL43 TaxID=2806348 RepID=UPI001F1BF4F5|nr:ABC transporter substrate-binding protein [Devosia sp. SL43]UJW84986.1 ABC transporter substrate-binding protein [Devosia sp. SL43]
MPKLSNYLLRTALVVGTFVMPAMTMPTSAQDLVKIIVGIPPNLSGLPVHYAEAKGYFDEAGLDVEISLLNAGSAAVPQLLGGQMNFATIDTVVTITGRGKDIPLVITAPNTTGIPNPDRGYGNLIASATSSVASLEDLVGKTVAVNQLNGTVWAVTRAALDNAGVDSSKVEFLEVPPPQMVAALQQGRVEVAILGEPASSMAIAEGMKALGNIEARSVPGLPTFTFVSAEEWVNANLETVQKFNEIIIRANTEINADRATAIEIAKQTTTIPPEILEMVFLPIFGTKAVDAEGVQGMTNLAVKYGLISEADAPAPETVLAGGN